MKFAKELEEDLVPEWRVKYLDYKTGKKKIKALARALHKVNNTPIAIPGATRLRPGNFFTNTFRQAPTPDEQLASDNEEVAEQLWNRTAFGRPQKEDTENVEHIPSDEEDEELGPTEVSPLVSSTQSNPRRKFYDSGTKEILTGNCVGSVMKTPHTSSLAIGPPSLELPDPAMSVNRSATQQDMTAPNDDRPMYRRTASVAGEAYEVGRMHTPSKFATTLLPKHRNIFRPKRTFSTPDGGLPHRPPFMHRLFSKSGRMEPPKDIPLAYFKDFDIKQADFFAFLDKELVKIESFYKMKEDEALGRLDELKQQLHIMRDRRIEEILVDRQNKENPQNEHAKGDSLAQHFGLVMPLDSSAQHHLQSLFKPVGDAIHDSFHKHGPNTKALSHAMNGVNQGVLSTSKKTPKNQPDHSKRDFSRRYPVDVSYRSAKRKLKAALQEFYRGLELLKSYSLLNRTGFRKISKKYDKAVKARPTGRYMAENVNKSWFVQSDVLEGLLVQTEDLYARYFERGNHKIAVTKLRSKTKDVNMSGSVFRNGILLAAGTVLGIEGAVYSNIKVNGDDPWVALMTRYLLQLYGGYFLALVLMLLFCLNARVWTRNKINYPFIFEFDPRHQLDWRQLAEIPSLLYFLLGLSMWLNFRPWGATSHMFLYWPIVLVVLTVVILFFPARILYHRSREWFAYSQFRLLLAGIYPVEFRDFFLGDMFCSLTYAMGNIELFFCLYAHQWNNPGQCNSNNSRLFGFLSCLPGIWRALQCLRRYYDTRNTFPHLVNFGKYSCTILFYMTLSLYRMSETTGLKALWITFGILNSVYCTIWDLIMDWSLGNPYTSPPFLRETLGYKSPSIYYAAMVLDPLGRFNWLLYILLPGELQHAAVLSFFISLSEIARRAMWTIFRVENEHCTNVGKFRASRDVPLPYDVAEEEEHDTRSPHERRHKARKEISEPAPNLHGKQKQRVKSPHAQGEENNTFSEPDVDAEQGITRAFARRWQAKAGIKSLANTPEQGGLKRRNTVGNDERDTVEHEDSPLKRGLNRVGTLLTEAHAQDYQKRKRPEIVAGEARDERAEEAGLGPGSSDEDEDEADSADERELRERKDRFQGGGTSRRRPRSGEADGGGGGMEPDEDGFLGNVAGRQQSREESSRERSQDARELGEVERILSRTGNQSQRGRAS